MTYVGRYLVDQLELEANVEGSKSELRLHNYHEASFLFQVTFWVYNGYIVAQGSHGRLLVYIVNAIGEHASHLLVYERKLRDENRVNKRSTISPRQSGCH